MDTRAIDKAQSRLRSAEKALERLRACETFDDFRDEWYIFLSASKNVYTVLEQGAKSAEKSIAWFEERRLFRGRDELLHYLYQARNDDEHGLGSSINREPEKVEIGLPGLGYSSSVHLEGSFGNIVASNNGGAAVVFRGGMPENLKVNSLDRKPVKIRRSPETTVLVPVKDRKGRAVGTPTQHCGAILDDPSPISVADLGLKYLQAMVLDATDLPNLITKA